MVGRGMLEVTGTGGRPTATTGGAGIGLVPGTSSVAPSPVASGLAVSGASCGGSTFGAASDTGAALADLPAQAGTVVDVVEEVVTGVSSTAVAGVGSDAALVETVAGAGGAHGLTSWTGWATGTGTGDEWSGTVTIVVTAAGASAGGGGTGAVPPDIPSASDTTAPTTPSAARLAPCCTAWAAAAVPAMTA